MILYLIRHGQTDWNIEGKIQGSCDIELNETGIMQAEELSKKVLASNVYFSKIYTSKQKRALKTAQILSRATKVDYIIANGLEEIGFGEWEGMTWNEIKLEYPSEFEQWYADRRYHHPPKGESHQAMLDRALLAIHNIISDHQEDVAIVTHSAVIMSLQCYITDTPINEMMKFRTEMQQ